MPRKISRETSLERSITVFWDHGYRGTSMEMLTDALGVAKPSIYANFGSKKALFREVLENYRAAWIGRISHELQTCRSAREGLSQLMRQLMAPDHGECRRGCMVTNAALEMAHLDPDLSACVDKTFSDLLGLFAEAIGRGQQEGEIRTDLPAASLARFIVSSFQGVRVLEKTGLETDHWLDSVRLVMSVLDPPVLAGVRPVGRRSIGVRTPVTAGLEPSLRRP
jgi:TetR/AcrR family transcriptional regulator, transcriptional repressor for nem operon